MKTNHATKIRKVFELRSFVSCYFFIIVEKGVSHIPACKDNEKTLTASVQVLQVFKNTGFLAIQ